MIRLKNVLKQIAKIERNDTENLGVVEKGLENNLETRNLEYASRMLGVKNLGIIAKGLENRRCLDVQKRIARE